MKIVCTSSYKTYSKENTKNYTPNFYVLILISVILSFLLTMSEGVCEYYRGSVGALIFFLAN